eukprot:COSAG06_NODE_51997_length_308_cov_1.234450_1_plen_49_part_01
MSSGVVAAAQRDASWPALSEPASTTGMVQREVACEVLVRQLRLDNDGPT